MSRISRASGWAVCFHVPVDSENFIILSGSVQGFTASAATAPARTLMLSASGEDSDSVTSAVPLVDTDAERFLRVQRNEVLVADHVWALMTVRVQPVKAINAKAQRTPRKSEKRKAKSGNDRQNRKAPACATLRRGKESAVDDGF